MYAQTFHGTLRCYLKPGTPHCGAVAVDYLAQASFRFTISVHYPAPAELDDNGFLLDNTYFEQYFESFGCCQIAISCERLVQLVADDIARDADRWHAHVHATIYPVPGVAMSASAGDHNQHRNEDKHAA